jgi:hypothetical protein
MEFVIFAKWNYCKVSRHIHIRLDFELLTFWKKVPKPFCSLLKVPLYDIIYIFLIWSLKSSKMQIRTIVWTTKIMEKTFRHFNIWSRSFNWSSFHHKLSFPQYANERSIFSYFLLNWFASFLIKFVCIREVQNCNQFLLFFFLGLIINYCHCVLIVTQLHQTG